MQKYAQFRTIYYVSLLLFAATIIWPVLQLVYVMVYFLSLINLIFTRGYVPEDPEHSSITHFERYSRFNWLNYAIAIYAAISALLVVIVKVSPNLTTLILWTMLVIFTIKFLERTIVWLNRELVVSYIKQQLPELDDFAVIKAVDKLSHHPKSTPEELKDDLKISMDNAQSIISYFRTYIDNNLQ